MRIATSNPVSYQASLRQLLKEVDYARFVNQATALIKSDHDELSQKQWALFCQHVNALNERKPEKLMLLQVALRCFSLALTNTDLAQFITLSVHLKSSLGSVVFRQIMEAPVPHNKSFLQVYVSVLQLLVDLHEYTGLAAIIKKHLPDLRKLYVELFELNTKVLEERYPGRNIDSVMARFATADDITVFPLKKDRLDKYKTQYLAYEIYLKSLKSVSSEALKISFLQYGKTTDQQDPLRKPHMLAILSETVRRVFKKILPYDTQIIALMAILDDPANIKGYIAQIKTGEGKTTIIAMLLAYMAVTKGFVDAITTSDYLAKTACKIFTPFYNALGLTVSHISHQEPKQEHFHAQILYGTNSDFEFALLRDMLNEKKLRYSYRLGSTELVPRTFDVIVADEVDNMMLDTLGAARMAIPGDQDISWFYAPTLAFVDATFKMMPIKLDAVSEFRRYLQSQVNNHGAEVAAISDAWLLRRLRSAQVALYHKQEFRDYLVRSDIVIVDYANTGRTSEGCQWQHGIHQFLQAKHRLKITPESLTGASISHPTYFGLYSIIFGLTGTMGEIIEREEVQEIYGVESFDVPPHFPSQRKTLPPIIAPNAVEQFKILLSIAKETQAAGQPLLLLFESIKDTNDFSEYLRSQSVQHQVLNETQRESEDYIVARAGQAGMITVATNIAARGTDIILSPESKEAGGLLQVFVFYPENSRVEGQGAGRAARQGQPGACQMVLRLDDPRIQALLKSDLLALAAFLAAPTDIGRVKILNALRTAKIKLESKERRHSAQLEMLQYHCLKNFISKLQVVHTVFKSPEFVTKMKEICESGIPQETSYAPINETNKPWDTIYRSALSLMRNYMMAKSVDWTCFIDQFKEAFLDYSLKQWSIFYSKLPDQIHDMDIATASAYAEQKYKELGVDEHFSPDSALAVLHYLISKASSVLVRKHAISELATTVAAYNIHGLLGSRITIPDSRVLSVAIGENKDLPFKLIKGFSAGETTHRWTEGFEATIFIPQTHGSKQIRQLEFETHGLVSEKISQNLVVLCKGIGVKIYEYNSLTPAHKIIIDIPADYCGDIEVNLEMPNACKPCELNPANTDPRSLAIAFTTAHIYFETSSEKRLDDVAVSRRLSQCREIKT